MNGASGKPVELANAFLRKIRGFAPKMTLELNVALNID